MSYRKTNNKHQIWIDYLEKNSELIEKLNLADWIWRNEANFREFLTYGKIEKSFNLKFDFNSLDENLYFELFDFMNYYFEMDGILFDKFNSRIKT